VAQEKTAAIGDGAKRKAEAAAAGEGPEPKNRAEADKRQEEEEQEAEKQRRKQAGEIKSLGEDTDSEEEDEKLPREAAGITPGELKPGPTRAVLVAPEDCHEPGETRNLTLVAENFGGLRVSVDGKRVNAASKFVMIKPGREQQYELMGNPDLEAMLFSKARKQAGLSAGLLEMAMGLDKAQLDELAGSACEIIELARKFPRGGDALEALEVSLMKGELEVNSVEAAMAAMRAVDKVPPGNQVGTLPSVGSIKC